ncbi:hypothetical protein LTR56_027020 [Elasticomyces elasticus]|nr:hypothetical protein LTR56_027020 [Elasticomyces elasticus]KAK3616482.1 hypothetical protein LTR22_027052 [Elasticomyces elasticus]KAK4899037.1 hypothetical protein LTR49_027717 [Elasticomyces elasticus]KAK5743033.1 hypothetical protein LTS12_024026 [Elasticomyces elasticus]
MIVPNKSLMDNIAQSVHRLEEICDPEFMLRHDLAVWAESDQGSAKLPDGLKHDADKLLEDVKGCQSVMTTLANKKDLGVDSAGTGDTITKNWLMKTTGCCRDPDSKYEVNLLSQALTDWAKCANDDDAIPERLHDQITGLVNGVEACMKRRFLELEEKVFVYERMLRKQRTSQGLGEDDE